MATQDTCCTLVPYFKVESANLPAFRALCEAFVEKTRNEPKCLHYGFSFFENQAHCREGYVDAEGLLAHLDNVGSITAGSSQDCRDHASGSAWPGKRAGKTQRPACRPETAILYP